MIQRNAKIKDALKTEYVDFVDFCISLDKRSIVELTTSDFIAFRTQRGTTRDYVASIRQALDSYDPDTEAKQEKSNVDLSIDEPSDIDVMEEKAVIPEEPAPKDISIETSHEERQEETDADVAAIVVEESPSVEEEPLEKSSLIFNVADDQSMPEVPATSRKLFSSRKAWFINLEELRSMDVELPLYDLFGIPRNPIFASKDVEELGLSVRPYNCLMNNRCKTFDALFSKNLREIGEFTNLGKKSLFEIVSKCKEIVANPQVITKGESEETQGLNCTP